MTDINALILADVGEQPKKKMKVRKVRAKKKQAKPAESSELTSKGKWDPYEHVTSTIVEALEAGDVNIFMSPWVKNGMPRNAFTGREYNGMNVLLIWAHMLQHDDWEWSLFLTWNQAKKITGANDVSAWPKEGEGKKRTNVLFWKQRKYMVTNEETNEKEEKTAPLIRVYGVYNIAQMSDSGDEKIAARLLKYVSHHKWMDKPKERNTHLDAWITRVCKTMELPIKLKGEHACYITSQDEIHTPRMKRFRSAEDFYAVTFHELVHASGHANRLKRDLKNRFGSDAYAFEELIAEFGAAFLCAYFNLDGNLQHTEYISSWVKRCSEDKYAIFTAAKHAKQAIEYLHKMAGDTNKEE